MTIPKKERTGPSMTAGPLPMLVTAFTPQLRRARQEAELSPCRHWPDWAQTFAPNLSRPRASPLALSGTGSIHQASDGPERITMRGRLAREWSPIPPRKGMQSIGGCRTSSQQRQSQEPSQPQHSRTNKFFFQGPSCAGSSPQSDPESIARAGARRCDLGATLRKNYVLASRD